MTDSSSSRISSRSFTSDSLSSSPAATTRSSQSRRLVSNSLQRPLSINSSEGNHYGDDLLRLPRLQHAESRFSLNEHFAASRREYDFEGDDYSFSESASLIRVGEEVSDLEDDGEDVTFESYRDFYNLLGLSRDTNPTMAQIATAYKWHKTSLALNEGYQSPQLKAAVEKYSARLRYAYETLTDPQRRTIYDLVGEDGLRHAYKPSGIMGKDGEAEQAFADIGAMSLEEFRCWFKNILEEKELCTQEMLGNRGTWTLEALSGSKFRNLFSLNSLKDLNSDLGTLQPVHLAVHQTFGIPLKRLRRLFLLHQLRLEPEIELASNHSISPCSYGSLVGPILTFSGGIISPICSQTHQARSVIDRSYTTHFMPSCAIQLHHAFPGFPASNGNLLLKDTSVDICTNLWPHREYTLGLGKRLTVLHRTRPFYCYLQTVFQSNSFVKSPAVAMRVERPVNDNALLYCQFQSANPCTSWLRLNSHFGPIPYFGSPFLSTERAADIGYCWARPQLNSKRHRGLNQLTGPDLTMHLENSFGLKGQRGQLGCTVTTVSACLSAKYSFCIYGNGIATSALPKETRGISIEMAAYVQDNLIFTGLLRALRTFGKSTQLGIGIAVKPGTGIFLTCSFSQWGQDLNIPVFVAPHNILDSTWAWMAVAVPCAIGVLIELAILRPGRERKRRAIAKRKRELSNGEKVTDDPE